MKKLSNNIFAKIMLILIAISFIVVGGISSTGLNDNTIASVDGNEISATQVARSYRNKINQLGLSNYSSNELRSLQIVEQILSEQINFNSSATHIKDIGIGITNNNIATELGKMEAFRSVNMFDEAKFRRLLAQNGLDPETFLNDFRNELIIKKYNKSYLKFNFKPTETAKILARNNLQTRDIVKASLKINKIKIDDINDNQLQDFYNQNKQDFSIDEKRDVNILHINPDNMIKNISDEQAKKIFEENRKIFDKPEKRSFYSIGGNDEQLQQIISEYNKSKNLKASVKKVLKTDIAELFTAEAPANAIDEKTAKVVFSTQENKLSKPTSIGFGKVLIYVTNIKAGKKANFKDVQSNIKKQIAQSRILDTVTEAEDLISEGTEIKEIAKKLNLRIIKLKKLAIEGTEKYDFTLNPKAGEVIFDTAEGETSDVIELNENSFIIAYVNKVYKKHIPEFNDIKTKVAKTYKLNKQGEIANKKIEKLRNIKSAKQFETTAKSLGFKITKTTLDLEKALADKINAIAFEGNEGTIQTTADSNGVYGIFIKSINIPNNVNNNELKSSNDNIARIMSNNVLNSAYNYIKKNQDININKSLVDAIYQGK